MMEGVWKKAAYFEIVIIIILLGLAYMVYHVFTFIRRTISRVDDLLDTASEHTEAHPAYKQALPYVLPILGYLFGKKVHKLKKTAKNE